MKTFCNVRLFTCTILVSILFTAGTAWTAGDTVMYQGSLANPDGTAVPDGTYLMNFNIFGQPEGGTALWGVKGISVQVTGGSFAVELGSTEPFGDLFQRGNPRWLEIAANLGAGMNTFAPRVPFTMVPHAGDAATLEGNQAAAFANADHDHDLQNLGGTVTDAQVPDTITVNNAATAGNADTVDGNHASAFATAGHGHNLQDLGGTVTDAQVPDTVTVNNAATADNATHANDADLLEGNPAASFWNILGNAGIMPGTHFLGTTDNVPLELWVNNARALRIEPNADSPNLIGGWKDNKVDTGVKGATIGGGGDILSPNRVLGAYGTVGGGGNNWAGDGAGTPDEQFYATTSGGEGNTAEGSHSTVCGGKSNTAAGDYSIVAGGDHSTTEGDYSFAAGRRAKAKHQGSFVWGDSMDAGVESSRDNQIKLRARGGMHLIANGSSGLNPPAFLIESASADGVGIYINDTSSDASLVMANQGTGELIKGFSGAGGSNQVFTVENDGDVVAKSFTPTSDRNAKENFTPVDAREILDKVTELPLSSWNFKGDNADTRHLGPMAQDFHAAFGLGNTDKGIATTDLDGVALAAIQGLNQRMKDKDREIAALRAELESMKSMIQQLTAK